ncbi:hypothetical protein EPN42_11610 [bacterium]|nr:MAG: hypothetical protein EPN42_11610 [bacterium]
MELQESLRQAQVPICDQVVALARAEQLDLTRALVCPDGASEEERRTAQAVGELLQRFHEELRLLASAVSESSASSASNTYHLRKMDELSRSQAAEVEQIASALEQTSAGASQIAQVCEGARALAERLESLSGESSAATQAAISDLTTLHEQVERASHQVTQVSDYSQRVEDLLEIVEDISAQTNLLSINAAIEAAHAGEYGRGFSVVADEVKKLAESTRKQTREITQLIGRVDTTIAEALKAVRACASRAEGTSGRASGVLKSLESLDAMIAQSRMQVAEIAVVTEQQSSVLRTIAGNVEAAARHAEESAHLANLAGNLELGELSSRINDVLLHFKSGAGHEWVSEIAAEAAQGMEELLESALRNGAIQQRQIDNVVYRELDANDPADRRHLQRLFDASRMRPPVQPPKFTSGYDAAIDVEACRLLDTLFDQHSMLHYLSFADRNCFLIATAHNIRQAWTGKPDRDLSLNRVKRIFGDNFSLRTARIGLESRQAAPARASHADFIKAGVDLRRAADSRACELRTYARDTGEILNDLSVGVYVGGEFFGCIRIGYDPKLE